MNKNYSEQQLNRSKPGPFGGDQQTRGESKMAGSSERSFNSLSIEQRSTS